MTILNILKPRKALNKAFLKVKAHRNEIELFKENLINLLDHINESESEEFHKNLVADFLKNTYYGANHYINTKGRNDLVIHNTNSASGTVGVILEAKKPGNKTEMLSLPRSGGVGGGVNTKAFQELVLYYLRERITQKNLEIKYLVATNIYEWFIFDANLFEKEFAENKSLVKQFIDFEEGRLSGKTTDFFYKQIAEPAIAAITHEITFTWFDIRDYDKPLRNADKKDDNILIALYKLLSPEHLLKLPFANDSNSLDKSFYTELLHIIGLTETKEGGKKLIQRKKEGERNSGSLIESAIFQLVNLDKISRLDKPSQFGDSNQERLFNIALELSITWVNRILFLKLLEAQLIKYHKGDKAFSFLNLERVQNLDDLNNLFFSVLARRPEERNDEVKKLFANVPYLNSSLFEPTEIEHACLFISQLKDGRLPLLSSTVIKNNNGQKRSGELVIIEYIFEFLNAYDFASEGSEDIQEDNKRLINASVLGLIFEKINGYKDGSFFTPGFITMYMCRETIRRAVVQKFNETKNWDCTDLIQLYDKIDDRKEANTIVNSLKICDPAVGSGHFLVSALNEIIAIKSDLKILTDRDGKRLKEYSVEVENDELIVTDDEGELFDYNPRNKESQRIQETLFHEKQTIIENCLFGVDINPNSVKICRLRLWIELLKNAYYKVSPVGGDLEGVELETLPNIDINIKCGNSLISRYALDADIKKALKRSKWSIDSYRLAVMTYRNAQSKEEKHAMEHLIAKIKNDFESEIAVKDKRLIKLKKAKGDLYTLTTQTILFERSKTEKAAWEKQVKALTVTITVLDAEIEEIRSNKIYENAFEWRFEFPEVLNDDGDFIGFDVVIGNPPYGVTLSKIEDIILRSKYKVSNYQIDTYIVFTELGNNLLRQNGNLIFIMPTAWFASIYDIKFRQFLIENNLIKSVTSCPKNTFEDAVVETCIIHISKIDNDSILNIYNLDGLIINQIDKNIIKADKNFCFHVFSNSIEQQLMLRIRNQFGTVNDYFDVIWGVKVYENGKGNPPQKGTESIEKVFHARQKIDDNYMPLLGGSEIFPFLVKWNNTFLKYGPWIAAPRQPEWFKALPRIVVRGITAKGLIYAAFIEEEYVFSNSVDGIRSKTNNREQLLQLLGILNSKFASYYHLKSSSNSQKDAFPKVLIQNLRDFPFESKIDYRLTSAVSLLMNQKKNDISVDTIAFETEIDQLVYQLYGLTEDEIKIVENR